jgi:hypothetical protein
MEQAQIDLVRELAVGSKNHKDWLVVMRAGLWQLEQEPDFLFTLLKWEAERMAEREPNVTALDHLHYILDELGLKFVKR